VVFYGTPHFGSSMAAMGWRLRHVPGNLAAPAPVLAKLQPGPHLVELNEQLRRLHEAGERPPGQGAPRVLRQAVCRQCRRLAAGPGRLHDPGGWPAGEAAAPEAAC
jgi:hypothetical protein